MTGVRITDLTSAVAIDGTEVIEIVQSGVSKQAAMRQISSYTTNQQAIDAVLTGYVSGAGTVSGTDTILTAIQKLNGNASALVAGVSSVYGRTGAITATAGDYTTSLVTEGSNLYYTNARVIAAPITGYTSGSGTVSASDTILQAIQKLNGNDALKASDSAVVHNTGNETVAGIKTFTSDISVPRLNLTAASGQSINWYAAAAALDSKILRHEVNAAGNFIGYLGNDANTTTTQFMTVNRTSMSVDSINFASTYLTSNAQNIFSNTLSVGTFDGTYPFNISKAGNAANCVGLINNTANASSLLSFRGTSTTYDMFMGCSGNDFIAYIGGVEKLKINSTTINTMNKLLVGAAALPSYMGVGNVYLTAPAVSNPGLFLDGFTAGGAITYNFANGTAAAPTATNANDVLAYNVARGYHSGGAYTGNGIALRFIAAENYTVTNQGNFFEIATTAIGSTTRLQRVKVDEVALTTTMPIKPAQYTTAGAPAYAKGLIYFDTTLNKLRVGGATAWETITSV